jgi:hypothetical protein
MNTKNSASNRYKKLFDNGVRVSYLNRHPLSTTVTIHAESDALF